MSFNFFPSFFDRPKKLFFSQQEPNEHIELFLRQHPVVNVGWIISSFLALFLPPLVLWVDEGLMINILPDLPIKVLIGSIIIWYLLLMVFVLEKFLFWYFNIFIVTNFHVIDVTFTSLLSRDITEIELKDIESVSSRVSGIVAPLFNYGTVIIETAAKDRSIDFEQIPKPDFVADRVEDLRGGFGGGGE
jgi:hypothetical protein